LAAEPPAGTRNYCYLPVKPEFGHSAML
jgi:hypothetical protein